MNTKLPLCLVILDGFGYKKSPTNNPCASASMPTWHKLLQTYPHTFLRASGLAVGLPAHTQGNSEVGHRTLGAGRIIPSILARIEDDIKSGTFFKKTELTSLFEGLSGGVHLVGLVSDGNVHASLSHAIALAAAAHSAGIKQIFLHAILDGRDVTPESGSKYLKIFFEQTKSYGVKLASVQGRFYAMDRDNHSDRTLAAYEAITSPGAKTVSDYKTYLANEYAAGTSDEFIPPVRLENAPAPGKNDLVFFFNIRPERMRQLTALFVQRAPCKLAALADYETGITPLYKENDEGKSFFARMHQAYPEKNYAVFAESEKEAHVSFYLTNLVIEPFVTKTIIPSRKEAPDAHPAMQAEEITRAALSFMATNPDCVVAINYANADMVGHTGNYAACLQALSCLDTQLAALYEQVVKQQNGILVVTADHGNIEEKDEATTNNRSHTTNLVPFLVASKKPVSLPQEGSAGLNAVAPLLLSLLED